MKKHLLQCIFAIAASTNAMLVLAGPSKFSLAVIAHPLAAESEESLLREAIEETDNENLAFVVATGIKALTEPCTDSLYQQRKDLFEGAKNGLIVSLAASDWATCKNANGKSAAIGRLSQLRDLFFSDEFSLGGSKIPMMRQSATAKFRSYAENARWEFQSIMFATLNLPANNNHYVLDAGRNSEFEDRLVANRDWLQRVFTHATRKRFRGIVIFCDGNPLAKTPQSATRDGFIEARRQITTLAAKFPGKVLLVHNQLPADQMDHETIDWHDNLGKFSLGSGWIRLMVDSSSSTLFSVDGATVQAQTVPR